jgi:transcriptional regulator with XRE-family HTH domain
MIDKSVPFIVRRARLLLGMTVAEFAGLYGAAEATVSQWECGITHPHPQIWARIRSLTLSASSLLDEELVRVSRLYKVIVDFDDLTRPIVASKGIIEALDAVGASETVRPFEREKFDEHAQNSPSFEVSGVRALEILQADPEWRGGDVVYAEFHCMVLPLGVWIDAMIAPLPDRLAALIEFVPSKRGAESGFWVRPVRLKDMGAIWP